jgi:hypothetical protein
MLITAAFHTGIWTLIFLIVGMIKPQWPLFFLQKPDRFLVLIISTVLLMITFTMFGEGNRQKAAEEKAAKEVVSRIVNPASVPAPVTAPVPVPEIPATKPTTPKQ